MPSESIFELPIAGAVGYAAIDTPLYAALPQGDGAQNTKQNVEICYNNTNGNEKAASAADAMLPQGSAFAILEEQGDYWLVQVADDMQRGYLYHPHCFINLPDVLPSAIYRCPNASASVMRSCGRDIPTLTGAQLYTAHAHNPRLGRGEYRVPMLYHTAKKFAAAQSAALAAGDCLVVYEAFRPMAVQQRIVAALTALAQADATVMDGITAAPWEMDWFIATGVSKHQRGMAVDVGLAKLAAPVGAPPLFDGRPQSLRKMNGTPQGAFPTNPADSAMENYPSVVGGEIAMGIDPQDAHQAQGYQLYPMPTPIHELSSASASLAYPVTSLNDTAWRTVPDAPAMTDGARRLRGYCTSAGLTPLASEWWHFNDLQAVQLEGTEHFVLL